MLEDLIVRAIIDLSYYGAVLERNSEVTRLPKIGKLIIYSNDHHPPHFHIISNDNSYNFKFKIDTLEELSDSNFNSKHRKILENWYFKDGRKDILNLYWSKIHRKV